VPEPVLIAVIDDDESLCTALAALLRSHGFDAKSFASAEAFLTWDGADGCACIVADIHMPGLSGIELKQLLVARQTFVPVIMITARNTPGLEARALASGAICLLKKPFPADALIGCIGKALGR
jgi:FixJ family two-component response regulator